MYAAQNKWDFSLDRKKLSDEELWMSIGDLFQAATEECLKPQVVENKRNNGN